MLDDPLCDVILMIFYVKKRRRQSRFVPVIYVLKKSSFQNFFFVIDFISYRPMLQKITIQRIKKTEQFFYNFIIKLLKSQNKGNKSRHSSFIVFLTIEMLKYGEGHF